VFLPLFQTCNHWVSHREKEKIVVNLSGSKSAKQASISTSKKQIPISKSTPKYDRRHGDILDRTSTDKEIRARAAMTYKAMDLFGKRSAKRNICQDDLLIPVLGAIFREVRLPDDVEHLQFTRDTITMQGAVPRYVEVQCERFPQLQFGLGRRTGRAQLVREDAGSITIQRTSADLPEIMACQWRIGGDLSLIVPTSGMTRVGRLNIFDKGGVYQQRWRLLLDPRTQMADVLSSGTSGTGAVGFPLGNAILYYKDGLLRCTIALDDTAYSIASSGLLASFSSLQIVFGDGEPRIDFKQGRLWKAR
jgi:hypothetical protein